MLLLRRPREPGLDIQVMREERASSGCNIDDRKVDLKVCVPHLESDILPIRRPVDFPCARLRLGQLGLPGSIRIDDHDTRVKGDTFSIRRPGKRIFGYWCIDQPSRIRSIDVADPHSVLACIRPNERDSCSIWRENSRRAIHDDGVMGAIKIDRMDRPGALVVDTIEDPPTIGRPADDIFKSRIDRDTPHLRAIGPHHVNVAIGGLRVAVGGKCDQLSVG